MAVPSHPDARARTAAAVTKALSSVPFYARFASAAHASSLDEALRALPLLGKRELRTALPKVWAPAGFDVRTALASGELEAVETAGTTGDRIRVLRRRGEADAERRRALALHEAAAAAMASEAYREARLTRPATGMRTCHAGPLGYEDRLVGPTLLLNQRPDPSYWLPEEMDRMLDELERHTAGAPAGLEGDPTHVARLARHAAEKGRRFPSLAFVALSAELATACARRAIAAVTDAPVFALHGSVETGPVFVETAPAHFTLSNDVHVELLPAKVATPGAAGAHLVVVTTLAREAQPLLRYVLGDIVRVAFAVVTSLEGRIDDALVRPDGALVTAGAIDRALAGIDAIVAYQVVQTTPTSVEASFVATSDEVLATAKETLAPLLAGLGLETRLVPALAVEASGRFRNAKRTFPADFTSYFTASEARNP